MTDEKLTQICAELDDNTPPLTLTSNLPSYLTSLDAIIPAIVRWCESDPSRKESNSWLAFGWCFSELYGQQDHLWKDWLDLIMACFQSSPKQLAIAWVKSAGRWED